MDEKSSRGNYLKFLLMIATSMVVMYGFTYTNSWDILGHAWFSETRLFMTLMMGGSMAIIMLSFMLGMYKNMKANMAIYGAAILMIASALWLVRSQATVSDTDYMEGMIPHHSIAILTSERASIEDPRVRELADKIIEAQRREIAEMQWLIDNIRSHGLAKSQADAAARPVPRFNGE